MANLFEIRSTTAGAFLDRTPSFPRFQRKSTWTDETRFRVVLSVFKGYPLGTVVVKQVREEESDAVTYSLLDGRQRYETLVAMLDPEQLWYWGKSALGINTRTSSDDFVDKFKNYIDNYFFGREDWEEEETPLAAEAVVAPNAQTEDEVDDDTGSVADNEEAAEGSPVVAGEQGHLLDPGSYGDLDQLLRFLLFVHSDSGVTRRTSGFRKPFDFRATLPDLPIFVQAGNQKRVDTRRLLNWINYRDSDADTKLQPSLEVFRDSWLMQGEDPPSNPAFAARLEAQWPSIQRALGFLAVLRQKVRESELGYIEVKQSASAQDDKKIFEIINTAGIKLTLAEILSATPVWNQLVDPEEDSSTPADVQELYNQLKVDFDETVRKWDVAATLLDRVEAPVVWGAKESWKWSDIRVKTFDRKITLGFRTLSGYYTGRLMKNDVAGLAGMAGIDWAPLRFEALANGAQRRIHDLWIARRLREWLFNLASETSDAIAMNFVLLTTRLWELKGEPQNAGATRDAFDRYACHLLDRSIYEYVTRQWRGSGDSRIATNLASLENGPAWPVPNADWTKLIDEVVDGRIGDEDYTGRQDQRIRVLLIYASSLLGVSPTTPEAGDVDHLITQGQFQDVDPHLKRYQHHIANLQILPERANSQRGGTRLDLLVDPAVRDAVQKHSRIKKENFNLYAQVASAETLARDRGRLITRVLGDIRASLVADPKQFEGPTEEIWVRQEES